MTDDTDKPATRAVALGRMSETHFGAVNTPVYRASTILFPDYATLKSGNQPYTYGRRGTPTQWALADALTELEPGAEDTFLYCSGVAAVTAALLSVLGPGDELLLVDSAYDPTTNFAAGFLRKIGITTRHYDPLVGAGIAVHGDQAGRTHRVGRKMPSRRRRTRQRQPVSGQQSGDIF